MTRENYAATDISSSRRKQNVNSTEIWGCFLIVLVIVCVDSICKKFSLWPVVTQSESVFYTAVKTLNLNAEYIVVL